MARRRAAGSAPSRTSMFCPHPWHGLEAGPEPPDLLTAFIEVTPFDRVESQEAA